MDTSTLVALGCPPGKPIGIALAVAESAAAQGLPESEIRRALAAVFTTPAAFVDDPLYKPLARELDPKQGSPEGYRLHSYAPYHIWGKALIEQGALNQIERAVRLPISVRGALMPDAHQGYGLPVGGVLATYNAVIPYAVGVDIACRMRLSIYDISPHVLDQKKERFRRALEDHTVFGVGETQETRPEHPIMDDPAWWEHPIARQFRDVAWRQLGTSGSGNHFAEFGALEVRETLSTPLGEVKPGKYLALLTHSGSRRFGFEIANHYTQIAMNMRATLPKDYLHLAWLELNRSAGAEYWAAMQLAGRYASANHAIIHEGVTKAARLTVIGGVENHHNFAWEEEVDGQRLIVHRKGATPAGPGVLGVIPGSMAAPGYVVRGRGVAASLNSAAHGAGRRMSRAEAFNKLEWPIVKKKLKQLGIDLLSAGLDEAPAAYKPIEQVMAAQADLVEVLAEFKPKLVKMDGSPRERYHPED